MWYGLFEQCEINYFLFKKIVGELRDETWLVVVLEVSSIACTKHWFFTIRLEATLVQVFR